MRENKFGLFAIIRPILFLLPLMLGSPFIAFCLCAFNAAMTIIESGPVYGGIIEAVTAAASVFVCISMGFGTAYGVFFAMQIVLVSLVFAVCLLSRRSFRTGLLFSSAAYGLPSLINLKFEADDAGLSIADSILSGITGPMRESIDSVLSQNGVNSDFAEQIFDIIENTLRLCLPSILIIIAIVGGYAVMWMVSRPLRMTILDNGHSFGNIRLGYSSMAYAVIMAALLFIPGENVRVIAVNGLLVFAFLAFAAGMSLVDFLMRIKIKSYTARIFIHAAIIVFGSVLSSVMPLFNVFIIYILAGITDCFVSIRKRVTVSDEKK